MKPISYKQEKGDTERLCAQQPHRVLLVSVGATFTHGSMDYTKVLPLCGPRK